MEGPSYVSSVVSDRKRIGRRNDARGVWRFAVEPDFYLTGSLGCSYGGYSCGRGDDSFRGSLCFRRVAGQ